MAATTPSYELAQLLYETGATARHVNYEGQWRGSAPSRFTLGWRCFSPIAATPGLVSIMKDGGSAGVLTVIFVPTLAFESA